jgi:hypothetical protein
LAGDDELLVHHRDGVGLAQDEIDDALGVEPAGGIVVARRVACRDVK